MAHKIHLLLIDDNPSDRMLERRLIEKEVPNVEITEVRNHEELNAHLDAVDYDIVVTDYQLMWSNGLEVLRMIKMKNPEKPVIMVTGTGSEEIAVEAMKSGLNDYIIKNSRHIKKLPLSIKAAISHSKVMQCAIETEARLEYILGSLNIGVFKTDVDGKVWSANEQFYRMIGGDGDNSGVNIFERFRLDDGAPLPKDWVCFQSPNGHVIMTESGGTRRWFRMRVSHVGADEKGSVHGLLEEITEERELERKMTYALGKIEENIRQFSSLSDRLRNPLSVISSLMQGMEERKARMAMAEMDRINEVLSSLDKSWIETHRLLKEWKEKER